jgi:hypothetical protein
LLSAPHHERCREAAMPERILVVNPNSAAAVIRAID